MDFHCIFVDLLGRNKSGQDFDDANGFHPFIFPGVKLIQVE